MRQLFLASACAIAADSIVYPTNATSAWFKGGLKISQQRIYFADIENDECIWDEGDYLLLLDGIAHVEDHAFSLLSRGEYPEYSKAAYEEWLNENRQWQRPTVVLAYRDPNLSVLRELEVMATTATNAQMQAGNLVFIDVFTKEILDIDKGTCIVSAERTYWEAYTHKHAPATFKPSRFHNENKMREFLAENQEWTF